MELIAAYPQYRFLPASYFSYDSSEDVINYDPVALRSAHGQISLLHEIAHCMLGHFHFSYDMELLVMEAEAWDRTRTLARNHSLQLDEAYIEDCLQTYSHWIEKRSTCPVCTTFCLQVESARYCCYCCGAKWKVSHRADVRVMRRRIE